MYAIELRPKRRAEPRRDDLTTLILETEFGGEPMTDVDFGSFFVQLVTAGNDTTEDDAVVAACSRCCSTPTSSPSCGPTRR